MMSSSNSVRSGFSFTATQRQEFEHQALVYKYMVYGMPVPSDLLFTIRRSLDSSLSSTFLFNQTQPIGWNGYHMGFGRKIDPEPGRCRRTDGKKWRCSKEAYPDSKYCERHMHRGRNRSRKPVELLSSSSHSQAANAIPINRSSIDKNTLSSNSISNYLNPGGVGGNNGAGIQLNSTEATSESHMLYSHLSSVRPPLLGLSSSSLDSTGNFFLEANLQSHASGKDYKNSSMFDSTWKLSPFAMGPSSLSQTKQSSYTSDLKYHYNNAPDVMPPVNSNVERDDDDHHQPKKVMHHFLDERPPKDKDLDWPKSEDKPSTHRTHLSISVPNPMHDFFMTQKWQESTIHIEKKKIELGIKGK